MSRVPRLLFIFGMATVGAVAIWVFGVRTNNVRAPTPLSTSASTVELARVRQNVVAPPKSIETELSATKPALRLRFRQSKDYAALVKEIADAASNGNAEAQYVTAQALRYCDQTLRLYFIRQNAQILTLDEAQAKSAGQIGGIPPQGVKEIYLRCRGFLDDPNVSKMTRAWEQWLDKAVSAGYPAAMAEKAAKVESDVLLASVSQSRNSQTEPGAEDRAREMALSAVQSGDPDAIFLMSDWVRGSGRSLDESAMLTGAWKILACQRGYDCEHNAGWLEAACYSDPQCAGDQTYTQYFQRTLGNQYDSALSMAKKIEDALATKNPTEVREFL